MIGYLWVDELECVQLSSRTGRDVPDIVAGRIAPSDEPASIGGELEEEYPAAFRVGVFEWRMAEGLKGIGIPKAYGGIFESARDHIAHGGPCAPCGVADVAFDHLV